MSLSLEDSTLPCPASLHLLLPLHQQACPPLDDFKPLSSTPHVAPTAPHLASPLPAGISPSATWMPSFRLLSPLLVTRVLWTRTVCSLRVPRHRHCSQPPPQPGCSPPCPLPAPGLRDPTPGGVPPAPLAAPHSPGRPLCHPVLGGQASLLALLVRAAQGFLGTDTPKHLRRAPHPAVLLHSADPTHGVHFILTQQPIGIIPILQMGTEAQRGELSCWGWNRWQVSEPSSPSWISHRNLRLASAEMGSSALP